MGLNQRADGRADDGQGTGERPVPRHGRAALLRLATWFEEAEPEQADALAMAAYALRPALHLEGRVDDGVAATTSWWQAEPDRSTVIERPGTRPPEPVRDHRAQQARLRDAAESSAHWRRAGAAQVRDLLAESTGNRARLNLSGAGMEVLMELLTAALGSGDASRRPVSAGDLEFALRLHVNAAPGAVVTIQGEGGELTLEGLRLRVTPYRQHTVEEDELGELPSVRTETAPAPPLSDPPIPFAPLPAPVPDPLEPSAAPVSFDSPAASFSTPVAPSAAAAAPPSEVPVTAVPKSQEAGPASPEAEPAVPPEADTDMTQDTGESAAEAAEADEGSGTVDAEDGGNTGSAVDGENGEAAAETAEQEPAATGSPGTPAEEPELTGNLPGPDPDVETTGPIDLSPNRSWTRSWG